MEDTYLIFVFFLVLIFLYSHVSILFLNNNNSYIGTTSPTATLPPSVVPGTSILETKNKFAYRIRIENVSQTQYVQLLGRYWYIEETSDDEEHRPPIVVDQPNTGAGM